MSQVSLVPLLLWVAAFVCAGVAIWRAPLPILRGFVIDRLLRYLFLVGLYRPRVLCRASGGVDRLGH
jgi:hypothetical protein